MIGRSRDDITEYCSQYWQAKDRAKVPAADPDIEVDPVAFDISPHAIKAAEQLFPALPMRCKEFETADGIFEAVLLVDVLEHVENPWDLLRTVRAAARFLLVRQPPLESFSTFRHDNYSSEREQWGHMAFFNHRSFLDMATATGSTPLKVTLLAPWELATSMRRGGVVQFIACRLDRTIASYFLSGFYLNGLFKNGPIGFSNPAT
jgi:hypothetical protein